LTYRDTEHSVGEIDQFPANTAVEYLTQSPFTPALADFQFDWHAAS
jgi:hypothetical protein